MMRETDVVRAVWHSDAAVWVTTSQDLPGLVADAATFEALEDTVLVRIEELLALNGRTTSLAEIPVQILGRAIVSGRQSRGTILNG